MNKKLAGASDRETSSARDRRRQEKIRQIVNAATEVFLEDGFSASSMDKIVEKSGVSKQTLYSYYESKEKIFIDVIQTQSSSMYKNFEPGGNKSGSLAEQLQHVGLELLQVANSPVIISLIRIITSEAQRFPKLAQQFAEKSFEKIIDGIAAILEREINNSDNCITDTRQAAEYFVDILSGTAYQRVIFGIKPPMDEKTIRARTEWALNIFFKTYQ